MPKNFGAVTSYLSPVARSYEQATWLAGRPLLDSELNLQGELHARVNSHYHALPSGFLYSKDYYSPDWMPKDNSGDPFQEPGPYRSVTVDHSTPVANRFYFGPGQIVHVAGMFVTLNTGDSEWIPINLPAAPTGAGTLRYDLVFIEVWRALLHGDNSITPTHRDGSGKIYYNGWVDSPTGDNHTWDIYGGPSIGSESSKRVQIQWRIRTVAGSDLDTYPDGIDETTLVFAQGPEASVTSNTYTNGASTGDPGVFISSGNSNTVDGFVYAIPLCAVARRNTSAFAKNTNQNGAISIASMADPVRPDGFWYDKIEEKDLIDLRKTISYDWDYRELLQKNFSWLLDGKLKTVPGNSGLGGGQIGTVYTQADEIGPTDTAGASLIGDFNGYQIQWSDALVSSNFIEPVALADRTVSTSLTVWTSGDQFEISLPVGADGIIDSVISIFTSSGYAVANYTVTGLNTDVITITLTSAFTASIPLPARTSSTFYVELGLSFVGGQGLTRDPLSYKKSLEFGAALNTLQSGDNIVLENSVPADVIGVSTASCLYRPSRTLTLEFQVEYTSLAITSRTTTTTVLPHYIESVDGIYTAADVGKTTDMYVSHSGNTITHSTVGAAHTAMIVDYVSREPVENGNQVTLYYESSAPQSLPVDSLSITSLKLHLLYCPDNLYVMSCGSANHVESYPYVRPGHLLPSSHVDFTGEHNYTSLQALNVSSFGTDSQFMKTPVMIPMAHTAFFDFTSTGVDSEGRQFFTEVASTDYDDDVDGVPSSYLPSVFSQRLETPVPHKTVYPCIGVLMENGPLGVMGSLLMVVFSRHSNDNQNFISFGDATTLDSCVSLYRLKGNPILSIKRRVLGTTLVEV